MNEPPKSFHLYRWRSVTAIAGLLVFLATGFTWRCAPPFQDSTLDTYEIEVLPDLSAIIPVLLRPDEPFVMANLLVFKEMATGEGFEGLTGAEAYQIYVDGIEELQAELGSRLIWAGAVRAQVVGSSDPVFETIALLEYASPSSFLAVAGNPGEAPEARSAGLLGQWLVASTTIEEAAPSAAHGPRAERARPPARRGGRELLTRTGLSLDQISRLLDGPVDEPVSIVELLRFADGSGELYRPYREALAPVVEAKRGELIWRGSYDSFVLGRASPSFDEMVVTRYPSPTAYLSVLMHPRVIAASHSRVEGLELHWIYAADETTEDLGF